MKGTKRLGVSESTADTNSVSKRIMVGPQADFQWPASSQPKSMAALDMHRAESSRQHVRALNNQFARWVQSQLQNHPDELWEDGVTDYLTHASGILEKFSDVVNWLKSNSTKNETLLEHGSHAAQKKPVADNKEIANVPFQEKPLNAPPSASTPVFATSSFTSSSTPIFVNSSFTSSSTPVFANSSFTSSSTPVFANSSFTSSSTPIFANSSFTSSSTPVFANSSFTSSSTPVFANSSFQSSSTPVFANSSFTSSLTPGPSSNNQFSFGGQSSIPAKPDTSTVDDGDDEIERPSSPSVKKIEESGILVVHEVKCKLYVKSTDPMDKDAWKDRGTGQLSIKCKEGVTKGTKDSKPTILVRNDVGRLVLNALIYPGIKTNLQKNSIVAIFHTADDNGSENSKVVARTFLIRTKSVEDRDKLAAAIQEYAPVA